MDNVSEHPPSNPGVTVDPRPLDVSALIALHVTIRDAKKAHEKKMKAELALYNERLQKIEGALHKYMLDHKLNSLPTDGGTAYISAKGKASIADGAAFRGYVIENRAWDLCDWHANDTATEEFIAEHSMPPPGVNYRSFETVGVRRPGKTS